MRELLPADFTVLNMDNSMGQAHDRLIMGRKNKSGLLDSIDQAQSLVNQDVCVPLAERFPLPEGEYYFSDLVGCRMIDGRTETPLGTVTGWQDLGGPTVLEVNEGEILVPFAAAMLRNIDLKAREIRVELPEGLLDLNAL